MSYELDVSLLVCFREFTPRCSGSTINDLGSGGTSLRSTAQWPISSARVRGKWLVANALDAIAVRTAHGPRQASFDRDYEYVD